MQLCFQCLDSVKSGQETVPGYWVVVRGWEALKDKRAPARPLLQESFSIKPFLCSSLFDFHISKLAKASTLTSLGVWAKKPIIVKQASVHK